MAGRAAAAIRAGRPVLYSVRALRAHQAVPVIGFLSGRSRAERIPERG